MSGQSGVSHPQGVGVCGHKDKEKSYGLGRILGHVFREGEGVGGYLGRRSWWVVSLCQGVGERDPKGNKRSYELVRIVCAVE